LADSGILILGLLGLFLFGGKGSKKKAWTPLTGWNQGARYGGYRGAAFYDLGTQGGYNAWIKDAGRAYTGGLDLDREAEAREIYGDSISGRNKTGTGRSGKG
jgi:hypothetical protein